MNVKLSEFQHNVFDSFRDDMGLRMYQDFLTFLHK